MSDLKPCPFCKIQLTKRGDCNLYDHDENNCILDNSTLQEKVLNEWNTRPLEDALRRDIVELRKALSNARTHMEATGFAEMSVVWTILVDAINRTVHYEEEDHE